MPVKPGETIDPTRTRQRIVDAAIVAIAESGVGGMSVNVVADRARASKATIYRAFGNRQGLIDAALADRSTQNDVRLSALAADHPDARQRLAALVEWHATWFSSADFRGSPLVRAVLEQPEEPLLSAGRLHLDRYEAFITTITEALGLPKSATLQLMAVLEGATIIAAIRDAKAGRVALTAVDAVLDAWRANCGCTVTAVPVADLTLAVLGTSWTSGPKRISAVRT